MMRTQKASRNTINRWIFIGILVILIGLLSIILGYVFQNMPKEGIYSGSLQTSDVYNLSPSQVEAIQKRGYPDAFTILFYDEQDWNGDYSAVRYESWDYYIKSTELVFINGEMVSETALDIQVNQLVPLPYKPEQFTAGMSLDHIASAIELKDYLVIPTEDELVRGGEIYFTDELTFGLRDNRLLYVETLPLEVLE